MESIKSNQVDAKEDKVIEIFYRSHSIYGTRKIQVELRKQGISYSRRRISRIMRENNLVSVYTKAQFKPQPHQVNEDPVTNKVNQDFNQREKLQVVVSDLTYVRVDSSWNYVCVLLDLHSREIIGYSFRSLSELKEQLSTYIHWFNHQRIHSTLGYLSPIQYQTKLTKQFV